MHSIVKIILGLQLTLVFITQLQAKSVSKTERYKNNKSLTYDEAIRRYKELDERFNQATLITGGLTDIGKPLRLFVISSDGDFDPVSLKRKKKAVFL